MSSSSELAASQDPKKWRFAWESHSHIPILRLYLSNPSTKPSIQFTNLNVDMMLEKSLLTVSWFEHDAEVEVSIRVPVPRVLVDVDSPIRCAAFEDHIQVKFVLLLPVDHPIVSNLDSVLNPESPSASSDQLQPLFMYSDLKELSCEEEVHFYCRNCSTKLTRSLRSFKEMPSANWREAADNWFGTCCCSFGGISEKLVTEYANSYSCAKGVCLLNTTSVIIHKDDLVGYGILDHNVSQEYNSSVFSDDNCLRKSEVGSVSEDTHLVCSQDRSMRAGEGLDCNFLRENKFASKTDSQMLEGVKQIAKFVDSPSCNFEKLQIEDTESAPGCHADMENNHQKDDLGCCILHASEPSLQDQISETAEFVASRKTVLNGLLGNSFMARSPYLSKDVQWKEFFCPECSCVLGAYPCDNIDAPVAGSDDTTPLYGGIHLFKCCISTTFDVGGPTDLFRKYTLERMFTSQLLESAKDELSFRTVVKDLQTKCPMLQIVLLNPNSWCLIGDCLGTLEPVPKIDLYPTIKVLFSVCSDSSVSEMRTVKDWITKNQVDDAYMLTSQIKELTESLVSANTKYPPSRAYLEGLPLSFLRR